MNRMITFILSTIILSLQMKKLVSAEFEAGHWNARKSQILSASSPTPPPHAHSLGLLVTLSLSSTLSKVHRAQSGAQQPPFLHPLSEGQQCHPIFLTALLCNSRDGSCSYSLSVLKHPCIINLLYAYHYPKSFVQWRVPLSHYSFL